MAGAATVAAAGLGATAGGVSAAPKASATVRAVETPDGFAFSPQVVHVEKGGTVTWEIASSAHTVTAYAPSNGQPRRVPQTAKGWNSGVLTSGQTFSQTFATAGVYDYFCSPHHNKGMVGCVVVGTPDSSGEPALSPPQAGIPDDARTALKRAHRKAEKLLSTSTPTKTKQSAQSSTGKAGKTPTENAARNPTETNAQQSTKTTTPTKTGAKDAATPTATPDNTVDVRTVLDRAERVRVRDRGDEKRLRVRWSDGRRVRIELEAGETEIRTRGDVDSRVVEALVEWLENR